MCVVGLADGLRSLSKLFGDKEATDDDAGKCCLYPTPFKNTRSRFAAYCLQQLIVSLGPYSFFFRGNRQPESNQSTT
jgi:hypothetical protein